MKFTKRLFAAITTFVVSDASAIPSDVNGIFVAPIGGGNAIKVANISDFLSIRDVHQSSSSLEARQFPNPRIGCSPGFTMNHADYDTVQRAMGAWCNAGNKVPSHNYVYVQQGGAIIYVCSRGGENPCSSTEIDWFNRVSDNTCSGGRPDYRGSFVDISDWAKEYGRDIPGGPHSYCADP